MKYVVWVLATLGLLMVLSCTCTGIMLVVNYFLYYATTK